jgi:hypothetical protein
MIGGEGFPVLRPSQKAQHRARPLPAQLGRLPLPRPPLRVRKAGPRIRRRLPVPPLTRMHGPDRWRLRVLRRRKPASPVVPGPARPLGPAPRPGPGPSKWISGVRAAIAQHPTWNRIRAAGQDAKSVVGRPSCWGPTLRSKHGPGTARPERPACRTRSGRMNPSIIRPRRESRRLLSVIHGFMQSRRGDQYSRAVLVGP